MEIMSMEQAKAIIKAWRACRNAPHCIKDCPILKEAENREPPHGAGCWAVIGDAMAYIWEHGEELL